MGRTGSGVEIRERSLRLTFTFDGQKRRQTLMINGAPMQPTGPNIRYATRLAAEIRERIRCGTFSMAEYFPASGGAGAPMTVASQLEAWLQGQRIEASTRAGYASAVKFWTATIGDKPLRSLKASDTLAALATRPLLTGKTVNNYVSVLREALALAVLDKLMPDNPAEHIPRAKHQKPPVDPFTPEETRAILADMREHYPAQVANYTAFKFYTGLRTSESFGLRWPSVDLASGYILVSEGVVRGQEKASTKTHTARRVRLNSQALAAIVGQKAHTLLAGGHVFHDPRYAERWADERAFRRSYWSPTLKRLGIRYRQPYNTRHTYATLMLMAAMKPGFCAVQMGHSVELFLRTYARWIPDVADTAEMDKLERSLAPDCSPEVPQTGEA